MTKLGAQKKLEHITNELSCKTVIDTINNLISEYNYDLDVYQKSIEPLTYVVVYNFNCINKLRLEIIKAENNNITYFLKLKGGYSELDNDGIFNDCYLEKKGNRTEILDCLKEDGPNFVKNIECNKQYIYAVDYLRNYAIKKQMNSLHIGQLRTKYMDGGFLIYKDVWWSENQGYKNIYCLQGYQDRLKISNSLVIQTRTGKLEKLFEKVVYDGDVTDLKSAWNAMKYVVADSVEEKKLRKRLK